MQAVINLHAAWESSTGTEINLRAVERIFYDAHQLGVVPSDIALVVAYVKQQNRRSSDARYHKPLTPRSIMEAEYFAGILSLAKAQERNRRPQPTPKDKIVQLYQQTQNPEEIPTSDTSVPIREALKKAVNAL